ncbi:hypothetical protein TNCV_4884541 [Trichonephila clavipes]|nr:hypothetical protein TNCV_4884541 [Trichonephila clavipes]
MFMMSNASLDVTDLDLRDFARFQKRVKFRARLLKDLRGRFRKVIELISGRNGKVRSLKLSCSNSEIIRPIQRVLPLEIQITEMKESNDVPLDAEALKIPSAGVDVSESAIPMNAPPNMSKDQNFAEKERNIFRKQIPDRRQKFGFSNGVNAFYDIQCPLDNMKTTNTIC